MGLLAAWRASRGPPACAPNSPVAPTTTTASRLLRPPRFVAFTHPISVHLLLLSLFSPRCQCPLLPDEAALTPVLSVLVSRWSIRLARPPPVLSLPLGRFSVGQSMTLTAACLVIRWQGDQARRRRCGPCQGGTQAEALLLGLELPRSGPIAPRCPFCIGVFVGLERLCGPQCAVLLLPLCLRRLARLLVVLASSSRCPLHVSMR